MILKPGTCGSNGRFRAIFCIGIFVNVAGYCPVATAQNLVSQTPAHAIEYSLEGTQFVGRFGAEGETDPEEDTFTFKDGRFATGSCLKWGFTPAPYWLRRSANGLRFLAESESLEHGTMRYEGVFDGKELTVVGTGIKKDGTGRSSGPIVARAAPQQLLGESWIWD